MKPGKRTPGGVKAGPKEGDFIPPKPGGDGKWRRVVLVQRGVVKGVEVWHGDPPPDPKAKKKTIAWAPPPRSTLEIPPVVEKFILWRFPPVVRPKVGKLTQARLDRYIRLALVGKSTQWHGNWRGYWAGVRACGITDANLMETLCHEFGCSTHRRHDKRRVWVEYWRKGKKAFFEVGEHDDPGKFTLTGKDLLVAARRAMKIPVLTTEEALSILAELDSINL